MWIYLLRHGIAEPHRPDLPDADRGLTEEGMRRLARAGRAWQTAVRPPDVILTSPLRRARQTAELFAEALGHSGDVRVEAALEPIAATDEAMDLLEAELLAKTQSIALVGHEPHLGFLFGTLATGNPRMSLPLKKGMLVGLEAHGPTSLVCGVQFVLPQKLAGKFS